MGRKRSEKTKAKIREANVHRMQSAEARAKVSDGVKRYFEGHPDAREQSRIRARAQAQQAIPGHYARMQAASVLAKKAKPIIQDFLASWLGLWVMRTLY